MAIAIATVQFRYHQIARILKWLALTLFAYVITAFVIGPQWSKIVHDTFIPSLPKGHEGWAMLVGRQEIFKPEKNLGTTLGAPWEEEIGLPPWL